MTLSISKDELMSYRVNDENLFYAPPRSALNLLDNNLAGMSELEYRSWTEISVSFDALHLENGASLLLILNGLPAEIPTKDRARGKNKEAVEVKSKTVLFTELKKNKFIGFIPPGRYRSIQLAFGNAGASFTSIELESRRSSRILASRNFALTTAHRIASLAYSPNPETVRRFKSAAHSVTSLLASLKDDAIGVKPLEEIPDGPYGLEDYDIWFGKNCSIGAKEEIFADYFLSTFLLKPLVSVVLGVRDADPLRLAATVHSVLDQLYDHFELIVSDAGSTSEKTLNYLAQLENSDPRIRVLRHNDIHEISYAVNQAITASRGDFVAFVNQEDLLNRDALFWLVEKINEWPGTELVYSDEDYIDTDNRFILPHFKSDWNLLLLSGYNYVGHIVMTSVRIAKALKLRGGAESAQSYDFLLRAALQIDEKNVKHVPRILYHKQLTRHPQNLQPPVLESDNMSRYDVLEEFLSSWSPGARIDRNPDSFSNRVHFPVPEPAPQVAIIIPTRDTPEVLERCINSLVNFTKYSNYSIHIIDNQSVEPRTLAFFEELKVLHKAEIHTYDKPFNYSDMHNWLIDQLDSEFICLLNNDTEIIEPNWLTELVSLVSLPGFGAAGSLLLYPDRSIQHAGVTLGISGIAAHIGVGDASDDPGYYSRNLLPQELSAVTAASLLIKRKLYQLVGGMNAERLPISFNDVDLCLKLRASGHKIAWTPHSRLIHHESKSRGMDYENELKKLRAAGELSYCALKWRSEIMNDPYYNPNFDLESDPYLMLASLPRLELTLKPYNKT